MTEPTTPSAPVPGTTPAPASVPPAPPPAEVTLLQRVGRLANVFVQLAFLGTFLAFGRAGFGVGEVAACFRVQYFVILSVAGLAWLFFGDRRRGIAFLVCGLVNAGYLLPQLIAPATHPGAHEIRVRALFVNVHTGNTRKDLVLDYINRQDPDFIGLTEVDAGWVASCAGLAQRYPWHHAHPRDDNFGVAFYSRWPTTQCRDMFFVHEGIPSILANLEIASKSVTVLTTHPLPPRLPSYAPVWSAQMQLMGKFLGAVRGPKVLMGDLNCAPWTAHFASLLNDGGITDTANGFGVQLTWPTHAFFLRTALDHILASPDLRVMDRRVGPWVGSDHFPVVADLAITVASPGGPAAMATPALPLPAPPANASPTTP